MKVINNKTLQQRFDEVISGKRKNMTQVEDKEMYEAIKSVAKPDDYEDIPGTRYKKVCVEHEGIYYSYTISK